MMTSLSILEVLDLFPDWFSKETWKAWLVLLKVLFGIALTQAERKIYERHTNRNSIPKLVRELWVIVGRRGGKSQIAAFIAVYLAFFIDHKLKSGERGTGMIVCPDRKQGRVIFNYIKAFIESVPMLRALVERYTQDSIALTNGITIEIHTASFRTLRGYTIVFCIIDEIAFLRSEESANPDKEILQAIRPGMATVPDSRLICISSPYARRGELWRVYKEHFGKDEAA